MADGFLAARQFAERMRFPKDRDHTEHRQTELKIDGVRGALFRNGIRISPSVTPALAQRLETACQRIKIPSGAVDAFVFSSPALQAECFVGNLSACIIRFSSSLIDLLDEGEFEFVVGHELGHFLLKHGALVDDPRGSVEYFMQQRYQEISVDRIGLLACDSLDVAIRALMKVTSGLSSRHLRYDVSAFVAQLRQAGVAEVGESQAATHPSTIFRCRALLWFSLSDLYTRGASYYSQKQMAKLNMSIDDDLGKFVDGPTRRRISDTKENLALWLAVSEFITDGKLSTAAQAKLVQRFGSDVVDRLKRFLTATSASEVEAAVYERLRTAREELEALVPFTFDDAIREIARSLHDGRYSSPAAWPSNGDADSC